MTWQIRLRKALLMPFDCTWNGWVRDTTAFLEVAKPNISLRLGRRVFELSTQGFRYHYRHELWPLSIGVQVGLHRIGGGTNTRYPRVEGDFLVIGPDCFRRLGVTEVICYRGEIYESRHTLQ